MRRPRRRKHSTGQAIPADPAADRAARAIEDGPATELQRAARRLARDAARARRPGSRIEPTPEQLARGTYATVRTKDPDSAAPIEVRRNMGAAIDRWLARGQIDRRQHDAASRYAADYARAGYERSVISRYDGGGGSGDGTPNMTGAIASTVAQIDARRRVREARAAMPQRLVAHFDAIVLHEDSAEAVGERIGRTGTQRTAWAIQYVRICADVLGDWYRLPG